MEVKKVAGRSKEPIELLMAKGNKHLSKAEIEQRKNQEIKVDLLDVQAPEYLTEKQIQKFNKLATKLLQVKILTELDEDTLARYIITREEYLKVDSLLQRKLNLKRINMKDLASIQKVHNRLLTQVRSLANELGLTITSRVKLVVPEPPPPKKNKFLEKFGDKK